MKIVFAWLCLLPVINVCGQSFNRYLIPVKSRIVENRYENTSMVVQRGQLFVDVYSSVEMDRVYSPLRDSGSYVIMQVHTTRLVDSISSGKKHHVYNSSRVSNDGSIYSDWIRKKIDHPAVIKVNRRGTIEHVGETADTGSDDQQLLLSLSNIHAGALEKGISLPMYPAFDFDPSVADGASWVDEDVVGERLIKSKYTLKSRENGNSVVHYTQTISDSLMNVNINGVYVIDQASGLIVEHSAKSIASGLVSVNGQSLQTDRRSSLYQTFTLTDDK